MLQFGDLAIMSFALLVVSINVVIGAPRAVGFGAAHFGHATLTATLRRPDQRPHRQASYQPKPACREPSAAVQSGPYTGARPEYGQQSIFAPRAGHFVIAGSAVISARFCPMRRTSAHAHKRMP